MNFRVVIFDLDGTLLDTLADIGNSANEVLRKLGAPEHPLAAYRDFVGSGVRVLMERILPPELHTPEVCDKCVARFAEIYDQRWNRDSQPYAGVVSLLEELTVRQIPMAVLSNKPQRFTEACVAHYFGRWKFAAVVGQRDGVPRKPDPTSALEIARQIGVAPESCLYLGDTNIDMETARSAGMYPVGAAWGFRSVTELKQSGAAAIAYHPCDVLSMLGDERPSADAR